MAKMWYPVIDYVKCIDCGACNEKCKHGIELYKGGNFYE